MVTKKGKAKPTLDSVMKEVGDAARRWRENAEYSAKAGHYIQAELDIDRALMLEWVLEIAGGLR